MQCPADNTTLLMTERQGVEIDYCPQCRGVWLDRGELDKLIERSDIDDRPPPPPPPPGPDPRYRDRDYDRDYDRDRDRSYGYGKHPKRKKWLSEMFDFD